MSEKNERAGLGTIIYSTDQAPAQDDSSDQQVDNAEVTEAIEESFPASDPPGFAGSSSSESS
ncbi:MAG: hypothetical protein H0T18_00840 [Chloroflexia bacterium]|nr:hypothetical protein [Chloroflexia bacterium]